MADRAAPRWRWWAWVGEAMLRLTAARLLVMLLPLRYWRGWLGAIARTAQPAAGANSETLLLARAVRRGAARLPFKTKCLPRAIALHTMLRRRRQPSQLVLGVIAMSHRGSIEDLHAWVESRGQIVIGELDQPFHPLTRYD